MTHLDETLEGGGVRKTKDYRRPVIDEEIVIAEWAKVRFNRYENSFFRALHINRQ